MWFNFLFKLVKTSTSFNRGIGYVVYVGFLLCGTSVERYIFHYTYVSKDMGTTYLLLMKHFSRIILLSL